MSGQLEPCDAFAERLREARRQRDETQVEAAAHMGIASATLSVLERRGMVATARFADILAVSRYYSWPLEEVAALCFGDGMPTDGLPGELLLLLRALPPQQQALVVAAVTAMARGLSDTADTKE